MKLKKALKLIKKNAGKCCYISRLDFPEWVDAEDERNLLSVGDLLATDWQVKIDEEVIE